MRLLVILLFSSLCFAQTFEDAVKKELSYLNLQYESMSKQKEKSLEKEKNHLTRLRLESQRASQELARLQIEVQKLEVETALWEKKSKQVNEGEFGLNEILNQMESQTQRAEAELNFRISKDKAIQSSQLASIERIEKSMEKIFSLIENASQTQRIETTYLNQQGDLVRAQVTRLGRVGAFREEGETIQILGPSEQGILKHYATRALNGKETFPALLFQDLNAKYKLKDKASLWDRFADSLPGIILALIFALVLGLFSMMARE